MKKITKVIYVYIFILLISYITFFPFGKDLKAQGIKINSISKTADELSPEWIKQYGANGVPAHSEPISIASDHDGNVYLLTSDGTTFTSSDFVLVKYDPSGNKIWIKRYDGPLHYRDIPKALAIDAENNIYVTGTKYSASNAAVLTTIKYNSSGQQLWAQSFEDPENGNTEARGIAVGNTGNIYVISDIKEQDFRTEDFLTLCYDPSGNLLWWKRFDSGNIDDPLFLTVDENENIIVGGNSNSNTGIIKYSKFGEQLWNISINTGEVVSFNMNCIVHDGNGNIYIAGNIGGYYSTSLYLAKYSSNGTLKWGKKFGEASSSQGDNYYYGHKAVGLYYDNSGSLYIVGEYFVANSSIIYRNKGYALISKIDTLGNTTWDQLNQIESENTISPSAMCGDNLGNIYILSEIMLGYNSGGVQVSKYNSTGNLQWEKKNDGYNPQIIIAGHPNTIHTLTKFQDAQYDMFPLVNTYNSDGAQTWSDQFKDTSSTSSDYVIGASFSNGQFYIAARSYGEKFAKGNDILSLAYDTRGNQLWNKRYSIDPFEESPMDVISDPLGNFYITGTEQSSIGQNAFLMKYDRLGNLSWNTKYNFSSTRTNAITIDSTGNLYTSGSTSLDRGRFLTLKYDPSGNNTLDIHTLINWTDNPNANDIAVDKLGYIYITGSLYKAKVEGDPNTYQQMVTVKYNPNGGTEWVNFYGEGKSNTGLKVTFDEAGNVYTVGTTEKSIFLIKYDYQGNIKWTSQIQTSYLPFVVGLALDPYNNIIIGGSASFDNTSHTSYFAAKYSPDGNQEWLSTYDFAGISDIGIYNQASDMKIDRVGHVYLIGISTYNFCTLVKFTSSGNVAWTAKYRYETSPGNFLSSDGKSLDLDDEGNVYTAVNSSIYSSDGYGSNFITILKYHQTISSVAQQSNELPTQFALEQNYPNPFNPTTKIQFSIPYIETQHAASLQNVTLKVYDILGREVATLVNEQKSPGNYTVTFNGSELPSGVYFYRLEAGSFSQTKKFVLLK